MHVVRLIITYKTGVKSQHTLPRVVWHLSREIGDDLMRKNPDIMTIQLTTGE